MPLALTTRRVAGGERGEVHPGDRAAELLDPRGEPAEVDRHLDHRRDASSGRTHTRRAGWSRGRARRRAAARRATTGRPDGSRKSSVPVRMTHAGRLVVAQLREGVVRRSRPADDVLLGRGVGRPDGRGDRRGRLQRQVAPDHVDAVARPRAAGRRRTGRSRRPPPRSPVAWRQSASPRRRPGAARSGPRPRRRAHGRRTPRCPRCRRGCGSTTASRSLMVATSSTCSLMNHCMNCSEAKSLSSRAMRSRPLTWSVTVLLLGEGELDRGDEVGEGRGRRVDGRDDDLGVGVDEVLDHHHGVPALLERLARRRTPPCAAWSARRSRWRRRGTGCGRRARCRSGR